MSDAGMNAKTTHTGDGATTDFAIGFDFRYSSEIVVQILETASPYDQWVTQVSGTDYDVVGSDVCFSAAPANDRQIEIWRVSANVAEEVGVQAADGRIVSPGKPWDGAKIVLPARIADPALFAFQTAQEVRDLLGYHPLRLQARNTGTGVTSQPFAIDNVNTVAVPINFPVDIEFGKVSAVSWHNTLTSPVPTSWDVAVEVAEDSSSSWVQRATFTIQWDPNNDTDLATVGDWSDTVEIPAGWLVRFPFSGDAIRFPVCNLCVLWRIRRP